MLQSEAPARGTKRHVKTKHQQSAFPIFSSLAETLTNHALMYADFNGIVTKSHGSDSMWLAQKLSCINSHAIAGRIPKLKKMSNLNKEMFVYFFWKSETFL